MDQPLQQPLWLKVILNPKVIVLGGNHCVVKTTMFYEIINNLPKFKF